ncbi:glycosyltransferase family A protein [Acidianus manzaensis]|uniref:Glycosyltransferase 2-like domain-containing protein n=1 Tax=Acidianus manzaensis TaxID=282676 RepID=A0A1W6JWM8_9CREN|nr:glycosyltransferase family A protein [Acidianus manzaensis]ARM74642.1 hypothetical protein B6F84_00450 [Acidianus manzaensis]
MISINIIAKNEEPVIRTVLDNIISQIDDNYEIIIVDNGSKDQTYKIIKEYEKKEKRNKQYNITTSQYIGPKGGARNKALQLSKGDYILCLDADQTYKNLQKLVKEYLQNYTNYAIKVGRSSFPILAPTKLLKEIGGWRNLTHREDWDLWFRLTDNCKYLYLADKDYIFVKHYHEHKRKHSKIQTAKGLIERYRDDTLVGLPSIHLKNQPELTPFYILGKILAITKINMIAHYKCTKYLREELPPNLKGIDWDLKRHYNLLKYEAKTCSDPIFKEAMKIFEEKYSKYTTSINNI